MNELKSAGDEAWEELKTGAERAWDDVKRAFHNAALKFRSDKDAEPIGITKER